ncbi:hypothetical protein B0H63DRAFT_265166 [Podospora didyma]|uniref:Uncharacterized protein n=1 Tax=Podospora didyma TaxID=330526 RepID=A0AAE0NA48_9PEZI|nr:hypothetical protein B0H63DRAFT_265166 [Podospora didyma]
MLNVDGQPARSRLWIRLTCSSVCLAWVSPGSTLETGGCQLHKSTKIATRPKSTKVLTYPGFAKEERPMRI